MLNEELHNITRYYFENHIYPDRALYRLAYIIDDGDGGDIQDLHNEVDDESLYEVLILPGYKEVGIRYDHLYELLSESNPDNWKVVLKDSGSEFSRLTNIFRSRIMLWRDYLDYLEFLDTSSHNPHINDLLLSAKKEFLTRDISDSDPLYNHPREIIKEMIGPVHREMQYEDIKELPEMTQVVLNNSDVYYKLDKHPIYYHQDLGIALYRPGLLRSDRFQFIDLKSYQGFIHRTNEDLSVKSYKLAPNSKEYYPAQVKRLSKADIENILGYKIEIINDDEDE